MDSIDSAITAQQSSGQGGTSGPIPAGNAPAGESTGGVGLWDVLLCETGIGTPESYLGHALNFPKTLGMAHILRGVTGIAAKFGAGSLNLAILDILTGLWMQFGPKRSAPNAA